MLANDVEKILRNWEGDVCPDCWHPLAASEDEKGVFQYCSNDMCLNDTFYGRE